MLREHGLEGGWEGVQAPGATSQRSCEEGCGRWRPEQAL